LSIEPLEPKHIRMFHDMALEKFGGLPGENEPNLIDSLAYKPFQEYSFGGETIELYPGLFKKAAVYMHTLATNQYFRDGNKRTAYITAATFLEFNGYVLCITDSELYYTAKLIANKKWDVDRVAQWLEENSVPKTEYTDGMEFEKEPSIELIEEYIELAKELESQGFLDEKDIKEYKLLEEILADIKQKRQLP
jgi:death-on-curing protein